MHCCKLAIYKIVNSNAMCCTMRGYEVIIQSDASESDTITVLNSSI